MPTSLGDVSDGGGGTERPSVGVVILNTNRRADTLECLESLTAGDYENQRVTVLDNASTDGSVEAIEAAFPDVRVIGLQENLGYAGNNNVGIEAALDDGVDWVFVLNEDTILAPDCLERLISTAEADPRIGILGPMVYHHGEPDVIQSAGGRLSRHWRSFHIAENTTDDGHFQAPQEVDWISGCAILVRRQVVEDVGMFDPRYFYYWEETEWCLRAHRAGWGIVHVPLAKIWHKGVQRDYRPAPTVTYYATRNHLMTLAKHRAPVSAWVNTWFRILRTLASWTIRPRWRGMRDHRWAMWRGAGDFLLRRWGGPVQL